MRRPGLKPIRERNPVAVAIAGLLALTLAGLGAYHAESLPLIGGGTEYTAEFTESAGLNPGDEVRVAGVRVGEVDSVELSGDRVVVGFTVEDAWVGDASHVGIGIKTLLGAKYLALDPLGDEEQDPGQHIPLARTTSPYDVLEATEDLGRTVGELDTETIAESFRTVSDTFEDTPPDVRKAVDGLSSLSQTVSTRDDELARLLKSTGKVTRTLNAQRENFESLLTNGNKLLGEVRKRRAAIHALLTGSRDLGRELSGLVRDNETELGPALDAMERVTDVLVENQKSLDRALAAMGPYYRLVGNSLGNGRWLDSYLCGLVPKDYLPAGTPPATGCMPPKQGGGR